jgi:hypothetical protein
MSGGPVRRGDGGVIGVFCSTYGDQQGHVSYVSLIGPALLLHLTTGPGEQRFLYDFVLGGSVSADETFSSLRIVRDADSLEVDFGPSPSLRSVLGD